ncbi:hypothetical protein JW968_00175 [Candidatus Woesearchaeota archaeon]|nr:hypothetical protein [Candidatus Woesearchaeota archaeon]
MDQRNLAFVSIVAIVAIVALVVMISGGRTRQMTAEPIVLDMASDRVGESTTNDFMVMQALALRSTLSNRKVVNQALVNSGGADLLTQEMTE